MWQRASVSLPSRWHIALRLRLTLRQIFPRFRFAEVAGSRAEVFARFGIASHLDAHDTIIGNANMR